MFNKNEQKHIAELVEIQIEWNEIILNDVTEEEKPEIKQNILLEKSILSKLSNNKNDQLMKSILHFIDTMDDGENDPVLELLTDMIKKLEI